MKKLKYSFGMLVMPALLALSLVCSLIAVFMPYAVEWMLGLSILGLASFAICYYKAVNGRLVWTDQAALLAICLSVIMTLLLILGGYLQLYPVIEGLNLLLSLGISLALLLRKNANRVALYVMIGLCLVALVFGAYSHIQYGRTIMATIAEQVLASNKVLDSTVSHNVIH